MTAQNTAQAVTQQIAASAPSSVDLMSILTLLAIIAGPIIGVWIAKRLDDYGDQKKRRLDIFNTLMRTRNLGLSYDHVAALNMVEVEFIDYDKIIAAWKNYLEELSKPPLKDVEIEHINQRQEDRRRLLAKLLSEIANVLKIKIDQLSVFERNYTPQGWHDDEAQQKFLRMNLIHLLTGKITLPISVHNSAENLRNNPYPERPTDD